MRRRGRGGEYPTSRGKGELLPWYIRADGEMLTEIDRAGDSVVVFAGIVVVGAPAYFWYPPVLHTGGVMRRNIL